MNNILNGLSDGTNYVDNFAGNNGDLTAGNVLKSDYGTAMGRKRIGSGE